MPLVWELGRVVGEPHGGWVHWGATTQNITQTGDLLVLRQAHGVFLGLIGEALSAHGRSRRARRRHADAGRTHGQHAVPATFGYKVAVWIDELLRHVERLQQAAPRLFVAMLGGGAGTFASLGKQGPPVQAGIGRHLGMGSMTVPSRAIGDHLAENICILGMLAATCGKIGREIYTLMKTEFGEVEEPVPPGHGRQLHHAAEAQSRSSARTSSRSAAEVRALVPLALEAMQTEHEADRTTSLMMDAAEARACIATGDMLSRLGEVMRGLRLDPARMRAQSRSRRRADHGRGRHAGAGRDARPAARARRGVRRGAGGVRGRTLVLGRACRGSAGDGASRRCGASSGCSIRRPTPGSAPTWRAKPPAAPGPSPPRSWRRRSASRHRRRGNAGA